MSLNIYWLILTGALLVSCNKLVETAPPTARVDASTVYGSDSNAETAVEGVYLSMMNNARGPFNGNWSVLPGLSGDEIKFAQQPPAAVEDSFYLNKLTAYNILNGPQYTGCYRLIYAVNSILDGLSGPNGISPQKNAELRGEAKFLRAFIYFYLVNLYGDVPLVVSTLYSATAVQPRAPADAVWQQLIADLQDAQRLLPAAYTGGDRTRPNQAAATALLARVWLYRGQWSQAADAAGQLIGDGRYRLEPDMSRVFLNGSPEAIWQLRPVYSQPQPDGAAVRVATAEGSLFQPKKDSTAPAYMLTDSLVRSFEAGDTRVAVWTKKLVLRGRTYIYPSKYRQTVWVGVNQEYGTVLRLAEMYLVRAEARARMGDTARAAEDLNLLRQRAGLAPVNAGIDLIGALLHERRVELFTEWGHRWMDLKRTGLADLVLGGKAGWKATDVLYPIPASELLANPNLTQNNGY